MAVFAKGMSNGYPMAAIIGRRGVMEAAQETFVSSTYWTESVGPAAALATISKHRAAEVRAHRVAVGERLTAGWREAGAAAGLALTFDGIPPLAGFAFDHPNGLALTTLFTQEMLDRGFLASTHVYAMLAHDDAAIERYLSALAEAFGRIAGVRDDDPASYLRGPVRHRGFQRLH
jgi:glutamate-1-semialdehyde aminotransferase